jgi:dTDP-glucose pyrophosphorylase
MSGNELSQSELSQNKTTLLIPLAGAGQRFVDAGYKDPKPLIKVSGRPMIIQAAKAMPETENQVFICRDEHLEHYPLATTIQSFYRRAKVLGINYLTEGQASTCLLSKNVIDHASPLHIAACDNSMVYDKARFAELFADKTVDAVIWTFKGNPTVVTNPKMYGWVKADHQDRALAVSCKIPISDDPINDHAVVGAFSFRRAGDFFKAVESMIAANRRVNNEFYVDECMNLLIESGLYVRVFKIDHYICWGTPNDLLTFEYWQRFFNLQSAHPYKTSKDPNYVK